MLFGWTSSIDPTDDAFVPARSKNRWFKVSTVRSLKYRILPIAALMLTSTFSIAQQLVSSGGGGSAVPGGSVSWSMGEPIIGTGTVPGGIVTQGFQQPKALRLLANIKAFLQGPYNSNTGAMSDALRSNGLLPLTEPYTILGYSFVGGGGESTTQSIIDFPGTNAIIDWVVLELRDKNDNTGVLFSRSALLQADGDIVEVDGFSAVRFPLPADDYYVVVRHRNHLGVMTRLPVALNTTPLVLDFTQASTTTFGTEARVSAGGAFPAELLWAGDVDANNELKYTGSFNDRDPILLAIGGSIPTAVLSGQYRKEDVNMDGEVKYIGAGNDRDPILQNIGGSVPTNTRVGQLP